MVEKKEPFDEKCRRLGLFDKSLEDIIDMIAEKNREIERLRKAVDSAYLDVYQTAKFKSCTGGNGNAQRRCLEGTHRQNMSARQTTFFFGNAPHYSGIASANENKSHDE